MKTAFEKDVKQLVEGRPEQGATGLLQTFRHLREQFRDAIFRQAPEFKPFEKPVTYQSGGPESRPQPTSDDGHSGAKDHGVTQEEALEPSGQKDPSNFIYMDEVLEAARR